MREKLLNAMLSRKSVRAYDGRKIPEDKLDMIREYIKEPKNYFSPYGKDIRFELIEDGDVETKNLITNAPTYIVAIIREDRESLIDSGYVFENLVLFLESLGLGTCYLNSGFQRNSVKLKEHLKDDEIMILASPIGFEGGKKSLKAKGCDLYLKGHLRKDIDEMFFADKYLNRIEDNELRKCFEYIRRAPSGLNSQPWRIVLDGDSAHFYIDKKLAEKKRMGFEIHYLDMGIILCHYATVFEKYKFVKEDSPYLYDDYEYLVTVE